MNEANLRRWVRGELGPAERREVSRWIVRCTDPNLGPLLHGLAIEAAEARADAALAARGGLWSRLLASWSALLDAGLAELTVGAEPSLILAELPAEATEPALRLVERGGALVAVLSLPVAIADDPVAFFLSDDVGQVQVLTGTSGERERHAPLPDALGPRTTIWAVIGTSNLEGDAATMLATALEQPERRVLALRIREA